MNLRITGPTPLPAQVLAAMQAQMVSHRSPEFRVIVADVISGLREVFGSPAEVLPFTASGTGGLEAAIVNTLPPGARVVAVSTGYFGDRFAEIARSFGLDVDVLSVPWGRAADPDELRAFLRGRHPVGGVLLTHNETSTGVLNPIGDLCAVVRAESDAMILVDVVSSLAATPVRMSEWRADVAIGVTQKALMSPPGLAVIGISQRVLGRDTGLPRHYWDFARMASAVGQGTTTYTPSIPVFYALRRALQLIRSEGLDQVFARHDRLARACRAIAGDLGLELFAAPGHESPAITALLTPGHVSAGDVRGRLAAEHDVFVAAGRGPWKDRMLRIGHMGNVSEDDVMQLRSALTSVIGTQACR